MNRSLQMSFAVVLALALLLGTAYPAHAEIKVINGITLASGHNSNFDYFWAYTTNAYVRYFMFVNIRAWGSSPNPLKDEEQKSCYNCTSTGTVTVADFYSWSSTQHRYKLTSGSAQVTVYTSGIGCYSSACWWTGGSGCSQTC